jgi:hypothetical protein
MSSSRGCEKIKDFDEVVNDPLFVWFDDIRKVDTNSSSDFNIISDFIKEANYNRYKREVMKLAYFLRGKR